MEALSVVMLVLALVIFEVKLWQSDKKHRDTLEACDEVHKRAIRHKQA